MIANISYKNSYKIIEFDNGSIHYLNVNNEYHCLDGPAIISPKTKEWWIDGKRHRDNAPAIETSDGTEEWYKQDKLHREDGPAITYLNGDKVWYVNGNPHRVDGPAIDYETQKMKQWWINGQRHRED